MMLRYQIVPYFILSQSSKTFAIRSFFFEKWLLTHVFVRFLSLGLWYHIMTGMRGAAGHFLLSNIRQKGPVDLF